MGGIGGPPAWREGAGLHSKPEVSGWVKGGKKVGRMEVERMEVEEHGLSEGKARRLGVEVVMLEQGSDGCWGFTRQVSSGIGTGGKGEGAVL